MVFSVPEGLNMSRHGETHKATVSGPDTKHVRQRPRGPVEGTGRQQEAPESKPPTDRSCWPVNKLPAGVCRHGVPLFEGADVQEHVCAMHIALTIPLTLFTLWPE